jgi:RHS repeat-associated protein
LTGTPYSGVSGTPDFEQDWGLSPTGNWGDFTEKTAGTTTLDQDRAHNLANEVTDITETTGPAWITPTHDDAGNMTLAPRPGDEVTATEGLLCVWDAWNRLRSVSKNDATTGTIGIGGIGSTNDTPATLIAEYEYDGKHRRIRKTVYWEPTEKKDEKETETNPTSNDTPLYRLDYYYNLGRQVVEVHKDGDETYPYEQYAWCLRYVHAAIVRWEDHDTDGNVNTLYYTQDANFNTTALVDPSTGNVVERYSYDPYGKVTIYDGGWTSVAWAASRKNVVLYTGHKWDPETGLYNGDHRYYHPTLGQWIGRDYWVEYAEGMNVYQYVMSSPVQKFDPEGLAHLEHGWNAGDEVKVNRWGPDYTVGKLKWYKNKWHVQTKWGPLVDLKELKDTIENGPTARESNIRPWSAITTTRTASRRSTPPRGPWSAARERPAPTTTSCSTAAIGTIPKPASTACGTATCTTDSAGLAGTANSTPRL